MNLKRIASASALAAAMLMTGGLAQAAPVGFDVRVSDIDPESGYGSGSNDLDVLFSLINDNEQYFSLLNGQSYSWVFGRVQLRETDISSSETGSIDVTVEFDFDAPGNGDVDLDGDGVAFTGTVSDAGVDYRLTWGGPQGFSVGQSIAFTISINDLYFSNVGTQDLTATVMLTKGGDHPPAAGVPLPSTMALLGGALLAVGGMSRRRGTSAR